MELADECERLSPSASGGCGGVLEVIEAPVCLGVLLVKTVTSRPLLPAEPRYTHLHKACASSHQRAYCSGTCAYTLLAVDL